MIEEITTIKSNTEGISVPINPTIDMTNCQKFGLCADIVITPAKAATIENTAIAAKNGISCFSIANANEPVYWLKTFPNSSGFRNLNMLND